MSTRVIAEFQSREAAERAEMTVLAMYNRAGDPELRANLIELSNVIRTGVNAAADENEDLI